jgi:hypothetical protein
MITAMIIASRLNIAPQAFQSVAETRRYPANFLPNFHVEDSIRLSKSLRSLSLLFQARLKSKRAARILQIAKWHRPQ